MHLPPGSTVAYLSPEFGVSARLPQYAGGLGVLAGDHLKAASRRRLPLIGIGLFYAHGYFTQHVDASGVQHALDDDVDPDAAGLAQVPDVRVHVDVAGEPVAVEGLRAEGGSVPLYLLTTDLAANAPAHRAITDRLYGGDQRHRLRQELVLGIGGVRVLDALGVRPDVFHLNEGHAGFSALERIRRSMVDDGLGWDEAVAAVRPAGVFTTHTPVPAGIDRFGKALMEEHFSAWCDELEVPLSALFELGHEPGSPRDGTFNMAVMGLRLSGATNGVAALHGHTSRAMFAGVWPGRDVGDVPIGSVTNGVDPATWTAPEMSALLARHIGSSWPDVDASAWAAVHDIGDDELWEVRSTLRGALVNAVRRRLAVTDERNGDLSRATEIVLNPSALTIGFARRFATYKRAALLLGDGERLVRLVGDADRPVQFVFAGKAHPADTAGQALIAEVVGAAQALGIADRVVFVEDYDMDLARTLVAGCDVWLNTPVRPLEACGTSGMKAVFNGGLNCSVSDGWWDECRDPDNGWVIASAEHESDPEVRDALERDAVFTVLERAVVPLFAERNTAGIPQRWLTMVRHAMAELCPFLDAGRMIDEYTTRYYLPAVTGSPTNSSEH